MSKYADLLQRVKAATGADRQIDWDLDETVTSAVPDFRGCPRYTASIDDALALVERMLPGWMQASGNVGEHDIPWACLTEPDDPCRDYPAHSVSQPLAILAALLTALEATNAQS